MREGTTSRIEPIRSERNGRGSESRRGREPVGENFYLSLGAILHAGEGVEVALVGVGEGVQVFLGGLDL